jgi:DUF4097 and DUF4098 domain-containing protein YvlB
VSDNFIINRVSKIAFNKRLDDEITSEIELHEESAPTENDQKRSKDFNVTTALRVRDNQYELERRTARLNKTG